MSFEARYPGRCPECSEVIEPGDDVTYNDADEVVHIECDDDDEVDGFERWGR